MPSGSLNTGADHAIGNHDGIRDSYFLSQADGTLLESSDTHLSSSNFKVFDHGAATGDIDADGDIDVIITDMTRGGKIHCLMNDGTGNLRKKQCGNIFAFAIELADIDTDGDLDLIHAAHEFFAWNGNWKTDEFCLDLYVSRISSATSIASILFVSFVLRTTYFFFTGS